MEARLRLTTNCNLNCKYCFADEFKKTESGDLQESNLNIIIKKLLDSEIKSLKIQGGEPTVHAEFQRFSEMLKRNDFYMHLYTNGLFNNKYIDTICSCYKSVIININDLNGLQENVLKKNINDLVSKAFPTMLGITLENDRDVSRFINFCQPYKDSVKIRLDVARPYKYYNESFERFREGSAKLVKTIMELELKGFCVEVDCCWPPCFFKDSEWKYVKKHINGFSSHCSTIVDISPDLKISSCFCGLQFNDLYLNDFVSLKEANYFAEYMENKLRFNVLSSKDCDKCKQREQHICQGGCLGHKHSKNKYASLDDLMEFRNIIKKPISELEKEINFLPKLIIINKFSDEKKYACLEKYISRQLSKEDENPNVYIFYSRLLIKSGFYKLANEILNIMPNSSNEAMVKKSELLEEIKNGKIQD